MSNKISVIGSKGKTGRRVFEKLNRKGADVAPASRSSLIPFDWYDPTTWANAITGKDSVYMTFQPDLVIPQSVEIITHFVDTAKQLGVRKLVLLSGRGSLEAVDCENIIIGSGLDHAIVRASFFMQNFSEGFWLDGILEGELVVPIVAAKEPFVDVDDIADVVVAALLDDAHNGKIYELTGPELLSFKEAVSKIAGPLGRNIKLTEVEIEDYVAMLRDYQVPEDYVWLIRYLFSELLDGRNESIKNDIEGVLKRKSSSFGEYVQRTIPTGIWATPSLITTP